MFYLISLGRVRPPKEESPPWEPPPSPPKPPPKPSVNWREEAQGEDLRSHSDDEEAAGASEGTP